MPGWYDIYSLEDRTSKEDEEGILDSKKSSNLNSNFFLKINF